MSEPNPGPQDTTSQNPVQPAGYLPSPDTTASVQVPVRGKLAPPLEPLPQDVSVYDVSSTSGRVTVRAYAVKFPLSEATEAITFRPDTPLEDVKKKLGTGFRTAMVLTILEIHGVTELSVYPYEVRVMIGMAFDWEGDHIHASIVNAITDGHPGTVSFLKA